MDFNEIMEYLCPFMAIEEVICLLLYVQINQVKRKNDFLSSRDRFV